MEIATNISPQAKTATKRVQPHKSDATDEKTVEKIEAQKDLRRKERFEQLLNLGTKTNLDEKDAAFFLVKKESHTDQYTIRRTVKGYTVEAFYNLYDQSPGAKNRHELFYHFDKNGKFKNVEIPRPKTTKIQAGVNISELVDETLPLLGADNVVKW